MPENNSADSKNNKGYVRYGHSLYYLVITRLSVAFGVIAYYFFFTAFSQLQLHAELFKQIDVIG